MDPDHTERSLAGLGGSSYTRGLVEKYGDPGHMAVWSYLELASFGGVISLYKYYVFERRAMKDEEAVKGLLFPTKALRNAAAHNGNMLSEVMDRAADRLHGHSQRHRRPLTSSGAR
ncbi:hypothetical protein [Candidatus Collinsella stercoripullorum]|uniref:hypothetical protein n=1 Tax=Candidatus Collinsella stercoripullorum TaxID=2838522 RepID=UPI0022E9579F|nr:hypothetical protein [Candidatus Collinsella stercoripullorum]